MEKCSCNTWHTIIGQNRVNQLKEAICNYIKIIQKDYEGTETDLVLDILWQKIYFNAFDE